MSLRASTTRPRRAPPHGQARDRAHPLRTDGVFFAISYAARRISTSIASRPSAGSRSRIFAQASRNWLAGTTPSLACTAVVNPGLGL